MSVLWVNLTVQSVETTPPELASPIKTDKKSKKKLVFNFRKFRRPKPQPIPEEVITEGKDTRNLFL